MEPKSTEQTGGASLEKVSPCFRPIRSVASFPYTCSLLPAVAISRNNYFWRWFARMYLCVGYLWFQGGSSPGLLRVELDLGLLALWCAQLLPSQMPEQMWDWDQAPLRRGLTLEAGLPVVPAHPAEEAGGPKALNFGTRRGAASQEHISAWVCLCCICSQGIL